MTEHTYPVAYGGWYHNDNLRMLSSSGGLFSALAEEFFSMEGVVYAVEEYGNSLLYRRAENLDETANMRGSKYYQADNTSINLDEILADIRTGRPVLIVGTSCQIGMFSNIFKMKLHRKPDNVLLVDLICHGVASKSVIKRYRDELQRKNGFLVRHTFRNKTAYREGSQFSEYQYADGAGKQVDNERDYFMRLFFAGAILRPCCYHCKFANPYKASDISIGDFNGARRIMEEFPDSTRCVSAVIANTDSGSQLLLKLKEKGALSLIPTSYDTIASQNLSLQGPVRQPRVRKYIYSMIDRFGFINTSRMVGWKYYVKAVIRAAGGDRLLNSLKRMMGRVIIEN